MFEKIDFVKWLTDLTPQKRIVALTLIIIFALGAFAYGLSNHVEELNNRARKECMDNNARIVSERNILQKKLDISQEKYLNYVESQIKKYEDLRNETKELKKVVDENN